jgi:transcriptional regulator with XRE-family HTH domain
MTTQIVNFQNHPLPTSRASRTQSGDVVEQAAKRDIIADSLRPFAIGEKLRTLRLRKKLGLVELGKHTGFSAALLSKLERGKLYPTLPTLVRIAAEFQKIGKEKLKPHTHPGVELVYVLNGTLVVTVGSEPQRLSEGDSLYFDSSIPHTYLRGDDAPCTALVVTTA